MSAFARTGGGRAGGGAHFGGARMGGGAHFGAGRGRAGFGGRAVAPVGRSYGSFRTPGMGSFGRSGAGNWSWGRTNNWGRGSNFGHSRVYINRFGGNRFGRNRFRYGFGFGGLYGFPLFVSGFYSDPFFDWYPSWDFGYPSDFYDYSYPYSYPPSYAPSYAPPQTVIVNGAGTQYGGDEGEPGVIVNNQYQPQTARPAMHEAGPPLYLIAFEDHIIKPVLSYWVENGTIKYITLDHQVESAPLSSVDRDLTDRLGRERGLHVYLPGDGAPSSTVR